MRKRKQLRYKDTEELNKAIKPKVTDLESAKENTSIKDDSILAYGIAILFTYTVISSVISIFLVLISIPLIGYILFMLYVLSILIYLTKINNNQDDTKDRKKHNLFIKKRDITVKYRYLVCLVILLFYTAVFKSLMGIYSVSDLDILLK